MWCYDEARDSGACNVAEMRRVCPGVFDRFDINTPMETEHADDGET